MSSVESISDRSSRTPTLLRGPAPALQPQRRRTQLRFVKRALMLLAALTALSGLVVAWSPDPILVDEVIVRRGAIHITVDEDGRSRVKDRYVVSSPLLATSARIDLHPGDRVEEGELLARLMPLEPALLDARTQAQAERRVASALARQTTRTACGILSLSD